MPLGGAVPLIMIQLGEVVFGGVGSGFYGMLLMVLLGVFIAGLMVGRTPEFLGKKVEAREVKLVLIGTHARRGDEPDVNLRFRFRAALCQAAAQLVEIGRHDENIAQRTADEFIFESAN